MSINNTLMSEANEGITDFDSYKNYDEDENSVDNLLKGSVVALVDENNPWFQNKKYVVPEKYIPSEFYLEFKDDNPYKQSLFKTYGRYKTNVKDPSELFKTHSFLERRLITDKEYFNKTKSDKMNRNILIILIIILILIYIYKRR